MNLQRVIVLLMVLCLSFNQNLFAQTVYPASNDKKMIIIPEGQSRTFMFTNQTGVFYYGETGMLNTSQYQGLSYLTHKFLEDYILELGGIELLRVKAEVHLIGDRIIRYFNDISVEEEVSMADSLPILTIKIRAKHKTPMSISPLISGSDKKQDFVIDWIPADKMLYIARKNHLVRNDENNYPVWLGICTYPEGKYLATGSESLTNKSQLISQNVFYPGKINMYLETETFIFFIIGDSKEQTLENRNRMFKIFNINFTKPKSQIEGIRQT